MATPRATPRRCGVVCLQRARFKAAKGRAGRRAIARGRGRGGLREGIEAHLRCVDAPKSVRGKRGDALGRVRSARRPNETSRRPQTARRKYLTLTRWFACRRILLPVGGRSALAGSQENGGACGVQKTKSETASTTHVRRSSASARCCDVSESEEARARVRAHQSGASSRSRVMPPGSDIDCLVFGAFASAPSSRDARAAVRRLSRFTRGASEVPFLSSAHRASAFCPPGAFPRPSLSPL